MPNLNFDYTQFLKKQNALYLLKYRDDPVEVERNPQPINGYHGHVPAYRGSIHEQRMVRSLVRCLTSPMKPTTATGFKNAVDTLPKSRPKTGVQTEAKAKLSEEASRRVQSAPPGTVAARGESREGRTPPELVASRPSLSRLSMMSAGSADFVRQKVAEKLAASNRAASAQSNASRQSKAASSVLYRPLPRSATPNHPTGPPQTLYGASFWYTWPGDNSLAGAKQRPPSYDKDQRLNRQHQVIYHKHEGVVPKYMGYVPGYKFKHGSTYGALTVNATSDGTVHRRLVA